MINTYFGARIKDSHTINVAIFSDYHKPDDSPINLFINDTIVEKLTISRQSYFNGLVIFECKTKDPLTLGNNYTVVIKDFGIAPLNMEDFLNFPNFNKEFTYNGDDLGFNYSKESTTFKIWAPLASGVYILIRKNKSESFKSYSLTRGEKGVYSITLDGDYDGYCYRYRVINNGISIITTDPYAKASSANGKDSCVIDFSKTNIDLNEDKLPKLRNENDAIIYELNVRDFTIHPNTDIENKGKYLGLAEKNRKTCQNNPCGLDYLKWLGITHVQVLPIYDFKTVDELNPDKSYNWGYDPQQYFVPEGSYSLEPDNPYSRIIELKKMVAALHKEGIKVNMDVVFNHVYEEQFSVFQRVVPGYYFRKRRNGTLCNGSFCGNDLDTKKPMVRKMIVDACKYWMKEFGIDGYRFDLMGIIDVETMKEVVKECRLIKPDCMIYGEGWDMNTELPSTEKTTIYNSFKVPEIGFFNDVYRDIVRGKNEGNEAGYCLGNVNYREGFKFAFQGSVVDYCYQPRFLSANQSINYVECHDNRTLYDRIKACYGDNRDEDILETVKLINGVIALSYGVSFYHAGQEIGLTKFGVDNSYNKGDKYNQFDWSVLDKRFELAKYFQTLISFKKELLKSNKYLKEEISKNISFENLENGGLIIKIQDFNENYEHALLCINPTFNKLHIQLDDYHNVVLASAGANLKSTIYIKNVILGPHELNVFVKERKIS